MRRAHTLRAAGQWPRAEEAGTITLTAANRHRRRIAMVDDQGTEFLLDLPRAVQMRDGDGLELLGGGCIRVVAAPEAVLDVTCTDAAHLARIAWHIGNRHVPVQILDPTVLRVPADHVLGPMLEAQGATVLRHLAPFQPEPGAYDPHGLTEAPPPVLRRA